MNLDRMISLTEGFQTKADKMRVLERSGVPRADIARFLGVRYQQVRNTLEGDKRTGYDPDLVPNLHSDEAEAVSAPVIQGFQELIVLEDENIALPPDLFEQLTENGEVLFALLLADGVFVSNAAGMANRARQGLGQL